MDINMLWKSFLDKIKEQICRYKINYPEFLENDVNSIMFYFLDKVIPVPMLKEKIISNQILISNGYYMISSRVENTLIFCKTNLDNKATVENVLGKLGY